MNWKPLKSLQWTSFLDLYQQSELAVVKSHLESTSNYFRPFVERKTAAYYLCVVSNDGKGRQNTWSNCYGVRQISFS